jgi:hypothetical protein
MARWLLDSLDKIQLKKDVFVDSILQADLPYDEGEAKIYIEGEEEHQDNDEIIFEDEELSICLF